MAFSLTSPITGQPQTGFTSPTYTHVADIAPDVTGKQYAITALGGTQAGVTIHSMASPFTLTFFRPKAFRFLGKPNPTTGLIKDVPRNTFKLIGRKGVLPLAGQPYQVAQVTLIMDVPAGSDLADAPNLRALLSAVFGAAVQQSAGIGDTLASGIV